MNQYITGAAIKRGREKMSMTQSELASRLGVSDKTVSKWETGKGYPDITLLEPLSQCLEISLNQLFAGNENPNGNKSGNLLKTKLYVCPVCGNIISAVGDASVSCCGIALPPLESELPDADHAFFAERVEDELYFSFNHPMTKEHYISFLALVQGDKISITKLYPEGDAAARIKVRGIGTLYAYCNKHGLFKVTVSSVGIKPAK